MTNTAKIKRITDHKELKVDQEAITRQLRDVLGPLVGTSLSHEEEHGWVVNVRIYRPMSDQEKDLMNGVLGQFDVPMIINERTKPPRLFSAANLTPI